MGLMNALHLNDGGTTDPFSKAVEELIALQSERFPGSPEVSLMSGRLATLRFEGHGLLHRVRSESLLILEAIVRYSEGQGVPRRDKMLLREKLSECRRMAELFVTPAGLTQLALEEAYLDSTSDERAHMAILAASRDLVFHSNAQGSALEDFNRDLRNLIESRRHRGWPTWAQLEQSCSRLESILLGVSTS